MCSDEILLFTAQRETQAFFFFAFNNKLNQFEIPNNV